MNHLESAFTGRNSLWRYPVMLVAILAAANTIGALPLLIGLVIKSVSNPGIFAQLSANPNDLTAVGFSSNTGLILLICPFIGGLLAFILLVKPMHGRTIGMTINGTNKIRWKKFFISGLVWLILSGLYLFLYLKIDPSNFRVNNNTIALLTLTVITILFIPFQASLEEVVFRGYLMQGFTVIAKNRWIPLIMTSLLFGLLHAFNPEVDKYGFFTMIPQYIVFGLIFGIVTILDDGIEASMGAHAANNIFLCIMVTNESSALQTSALLNQSNIHPWTEFAALICTGIIFILVLKRIFRWGSMSLIFEKINGSHS
jgi:uncharacterized protein